MSNLNTEQTNRVIIKDADDDPSLDFSKIKLETTEVDLSAIKQIDGYQELRYKDAIYIGTVINNKRHGKGVMRYRNGR